MKEYKRNIIEKIGFDEGVEALKLLAPSTTVVLDYLINALENGINRNTDGKETIALWDRTLTLVKSARSLYH